MSDEGSSDNSTIANDAVVNGTASESSSSSGRGTGVGGPETGGDDQEGTPPGPPRPAIEGMVENGVRSGEPVTLVGSGFGLDTEAVRVMIGGRECRDPELCHRTCRPCDDDHPCDFDEICIKEGMSKDTQKVGGDRRGGLG